MRKKRPPQHPDELFDKREPVEAESPDVDDEENFKAFGVVEGGSTGPYGEHPLVGSKEWRNDAKRRAGRPTRYR